MRGLWAVALAVTAMLVPFGTARAQFVGIPKPAYDHCNGHQERPAHDRHRRRQAAFRNRPGLDRCPGLCDTERPLQGELARRASQIETVQRRADALCDFLRCGESHPWLRWQCRRTRIARLRAALDRQRQNSFSFGRTAARPNRPQIRYDDHRSLILLLSRPDSAQAPSRAVTQQSHVSDGHFAEVD